MAELCLLLQHNTWGHTTAPTVARSARRAVWHHVAGHTAATHCCPPLPSAAHFYAHAMPQLYSSMRSWAVTPFSFAAKMPASPSNCREPWLPRPRQRVRPELRHVVVLRHQILNTTLLIFSLFFTPFLQVIAAEGEQKASRALKEASEVISESSSALQLRYLQVRYPLALQRPPVRRPRSDGRQARLVCRIRRMKGLFIDEVIHVWFVFLWLLKPLSPSQITIFLTLVGQHNFFLNAYDVIHVWFVFFMID